ncbi:10083_t:CDS:10, partial [Paraglomus occultum]
KLRHNRTPAGKLRDELWQATTYQEWENKARELDVMLGNDVWKANPRSPYYDYKLIEHRLSLLREDRKKQDVMAVIYLLRCGLLRNLGGLNDVRLFQRSYLGTKNLIEEYTREVVSQLEYVANSELTLQSKVEFFHDTKQSFGCSALVLYGGAAFGLYHLGVVKALNERGLLPRIISGTAIGALIAALVCINTDEELPQIFQPNGIDLGAFSRVGQKGNVRRKITRYLMDVRVLQECVESNIGNLTFEEAFIKTKRILNITVNSARKFEVPQLLNYLTAPNVLIRSAALASVAVTGLYDSVDLLAKDKTGAIVPWAPSHIQWKDSVPSESEYPFQRITELFNVNHFILSQANPAVVPFMPKESSNKINGFLLKCGHFISSEVQHRLYQLEHMHLLPKLFRSVVDEKLTANVTITPHISFSDFKQLVSNPTNNSLDYWIKKGEQSTWPLLALIRNRTSIELALDRLTLSLKQTQSDRVTATLTEERKKRTRTKSIQ